MNSSNHDPCSQQPFDRYCIHSGPRQCQTFLRLLCITSLRWDRGTHLDVIHEQAFVDAIENPTQCLVLLRDWGIVGTYFRTNNVGQNIIIAPVSSVSRKERCFVSLRSKIVHHWAWKMGRDTWDCNSGVSEILMSLVCQDLGSTNRSRILGCGRSIFTTLA